MKAEKVLSNDELVLILVTVSVVYHKLLDGVDNKNEDFVGYNQACFISDKVSDLLLELVELYGLNIYSDLLEG